MAIVADSLLIYRESLVFCTIPLVLMNLPVATGYSVAQGSDRDHGRPPGSEIYYSGYTNYPRAPDPLPANTSANRHPEMYTTASVLKFNDSATDDQVERYFRPLIRVFTMDARCRTYEFIVSFVLLGVTCIFGFVGNVLSILTLRRDSVKSVTTFLLSALAVADTAFLVPVVFVILIPTGCEFYQNCPERLNNVIPILEQFGWGITGTCHTCTVYVTVLVAVHRYLWVCRLESARRLSGLRRTKFQVAAVPVFALLYNSPRFFEYRVIHYSWNDTTSAGVNVIRRETTKILATVGRNEVFQIGYKNVLFIVVMYAVPLAILILVSANLIRTLRIRRDTLRRLGSTNSSSASSSRRDDNITLVLVIIIAAFIVCQTPIMIQRLMLAVSGTSALLGCGTFYFYFEHFAYYMVLLNSSTNFVIYILFSPHFRQTLIAEVLRKRRPAGTVAPPSARQGSRNRKRSGDERESAFLIGKKPDPKSTRSTNPNVESATENRSRGQKAAATANGVNKRLLTTPEINGGLASAVFSNCSQTTNQETWLMSEDPDDIAASTPDPERNCGVVVRTAAAEGALEGKDGRLSDNEAY
ncbi:hypothetical protein LSH36_533g01050 [Paralvinella palmiformis]|uniref:G-protein coupled receptors family 1 profile domain-containing protein n=1 Tax=Paralvinella palmiformis TaxID=53620 RepID=A0AAD9J744_9ANNE|nr:hypothetical protein LSH36_533g01050 [Paralvinella palmiformis]